MLCSCSKQSTKAVCQRDAEDSEEHLRYRCPSGWTRFKSHCYKGDDNVQNWDWHEEKCLEKGGKLLTIQNQAENVFIHNWIRSGKAGTKPNYSVWGGLRRNPSNGIFKWSDNSALIYKNWGYANGSEYQLDKDMFRYLNLSSKTTFQNQ